MNITFIQTNHREQGQNESQVAEMKFAFFVNLMSINDLLHSVFFLFM